MNPFIQLCGALLLSVCTAAHAVAFAEVKTTGCDITVIGMRVSSTYLWEGMEHLAVFPDGCHIAFVAKLDHPKTVKIIQICAAAGEQ